MTSHYSLIEKIKASANIVDFIGADITLKRSGKSLVGICPFHDDHNPSLSVDEDTQRFFCHACKAKGDVLTYVQKKLGCSLNEAIASLMRELNIEQPPLEELSESQKHHFSLINSLKFAHQCFRSSFASLKESDQAFKYFSSRAIPASIAEQFELGFAPDDWTYLSRRVASPYKDNFTELSLVIEKNDKAFDFFRNRIIFPIHDERGVVHGFGGRQIKNDGGPKYLNSKESILFSKSDLLYGLFQSKSAIRDARLVYVVEGYMDVLRMHEHGFHNTVSVMGTDFSKAHADKLFRLCDSIVFIFDGDDAGQEASVRALETCLPYLIAGREISFIVLPSGSDPDDFLANNGSVGFNTFVSSNTCGVTDMLIDSISKRVPALKCYDAVNASLLSAVIPFIKLIPCLFYQSVILNALSMRTCIPLPSLMQLLRTVDV